MFCQKIFLEDEIKNLLQRKENMKLKDFLKHPNTCKCGIYVTNGDILLSKNSLIINFLDKYKLKKIKQKKLNINTIPYESGAFIKLHDSILEDNGYKLKQIDNWKKHSDNPVFFDKKYIDFIERYVKPDKYTLVPWKIAYGAQRYCLKFWKNGKFCGCLCEYLIKGLS